MIIFHNFSSFLHVCVNVHVDFTTYQNCLQITVYTLIITFLTEICSTWMLSNSPMSEFAQDDNRHSASWSAGLDSLEREQLRDANAHEPAQLSSSAEGALGRHHSPPIHTVSDTSTGANPTTGTLMTPAAHNLNRLLDQVEPVISNPSEHLSLPVFFLFLLQYPFELFSLPAFFLS